MRTFACTILHTSPLHIVTLCIYININIGIEFQLNGAQPPSLAFVASTDCRAASNRSRRQLCPRHHVKQFESRLPASTNFTCTDSRVEADDLRLKGTWEEMALGRTRSSLSTGRLSLSTVTRLLGAKTPKLLMNAFDSLHWAVVFGLFRVFKRAMRVAVLVLSF